MLLLVTIARKLERATGDSSVDPMEYGQEREAEIDWRIDDVRSGRVELIPAEQVFAELDAKLDERRRGRAPSGSRPGARVGGR